MAEDGFVFKFGRVSPFAGQHQAPHWGWADDDDRRDDAT